MLFSFKRILPIFNFLSSLSVLPHPKGKVSFQGFNDNMVMVIHKAIGVAYPLVSFVHMVKKLQETLPVFLIHEAGLLLVAPAGNVIDCSRIFYS